MQNTKAFGPRDDIATIGGDISFIGVDELHAPQMVAPGYVCSAQNKRFRFGKCSDREGISLLPWCKGDGRTPFDEVYGGAVIADPNDEITLTGVINEYALIAADGGVWRIRANQAAQPVPLPPGVTLTAATFTQFIQANAAVILLRGFQNAPLMCTDLETGFLPIAQENEWPVTLLAATNQINFPANNLMIGDPVQFSAPAATAFPNPNLVYALPAGITAGQTYYVVSTPNADLVTVAATPGGTPVTWNLSSTDTKVYAATITVLDGAVPIPNASFGLFAQNRLFLINGKDTLLASDIGDFTRYQPAIYVFRVNEGDSYTLSALFLYNQNELIFFEDGVVRMATGVSGDLSGAAGPLDVTKSYGIAAPRGIADSGTDVYWLSSDLRIVNLQMTQLNQTQATDAALSDFLVQTFGRINAAYKASARLAVFGGFLYCALPLDDAKLVAPANLVPATAGYDSPANLPGSNLPAGFSYTLSGLTIGQTYQYAQTANNDLQLWNGTEILGGDATFVASGTSVKLVGQAQYSTVTAQVLAVPAVGVNTAVAVYDFTNNAWCGTDEAPGVTCVVDWLKMTIAGRQRLCFIGADGFLHLYGDQYDYPFEDEQMLPVAAPYTDILFDDATWNISGLQLTVDSGYTVNLNNGASVNSYPPTWGTLTSALAKQNLWTDANGEGGYNPAATHSWANGWPASQIADGVRFEVFPGTSNLPAIELGVANVTLYTLANGRQWFLTADTHQGNEVQSVPIESRVLSRGYPCSKLFTQASFQSLSYMSEGLATRFTKAALQLQAWAPEYSINTYTQGAGDVENYLTDITRNRLALAVHGAPAWNPTNVNSDYNAPGREDYSWQENGGGLYLQAGVVIDQLQEFVDRVPVAEAGLWMQIELLNTAGHVEVAAVALEAQTGIVDSGPQIK